MASHRLWCRVGIHRWGKWKRYDVELIPMGDIDDQLTVDQIQSEGGVDVDHLKLITRRRWCKSCDIGQVEQSVSWKE